MTNAQDMRCPSCGGAASERRGSVLVCASIVERWAPTMGWHGVRGADVLVYSGRCSAVLGPTVEG